MNKKEISIIICTKDRAKSLEKTLASATKNLIKSNQSFEIIIVDNGSLDNTREIIYRYKKILPIRYIFEPKIGHSFALNTGISKATGDLILFTDDDINFNKKWINSYWDAFQRHKKAGYFFGKITPKFEIDPPKWWNCLTPRSLSGRDMGNNELIFKNSCWECDLVGVNIAIPKKVLKKYKFDNFLGLSTITGLIGGNETQLGRKIIHNMSYVVYVPESNITHRISKNRLNLNYLKKRKFGLGRASIYFEKENSLKSIFKLIKEIIKYIIYKIENDNLGWRKSRLNIEKLLGRLSERFYFKYRNKRIYENINNL